MCGIAGLVGKSVGPMHEECMRRMINTLTHRGPDDSGVFVQPGAALGHARLSIIDLTGGRQPMHNGDRSLWIVFNGEIFNYLELRQELIEKGHIFATRSDTEVILHLFEELGEKCTSRLNGQWAFAIWDTKQQRLFLSRDRHGVRPLFYTNTNGVLVFASEIKAIFAYPGVSRELDLEALSQVFTFWHTLPPRTAFRGIRELPPGCSAFVDYGNVTVSRYWQMQYDPAPYLDECEEGYGQELLSLLADATRLRLRSDVPVGAYLSGGLDSTVISALIKQAGTARLRTFSVTFDDADVDEGAYQREAVRSLETEHSEIRCSKDEIREIFPDVIWHAEAPILRTAPAPLYMLSKLVRESGYKVVLTGEGSDEILGGYDIFKEIKIREFWARQPSSRIRPRLLARLYPYLPGIRTQPGAYLQAFFHIRDEDTKSACFSHLPRWRLTSSLQCLFSDAVKEQVRNYEPIAEIESALPAAYHGWTPFLRAQFLESCYLLPGYILSSQGDRVAMAHSVEGRFPFLDHRIADFASRLPVTLKMKVLREKYLLKKCGTDLVPESIVRRPKQPYRAPDAHSFFSSKKNDYVEELLSAEQIRRNGIFNPGGVQKLVVKAQAGEIASMRDNMAIVGILSTQLLMHAFINNYTG